MTPVHGARIAIGLACLVSARRAWAESGSTRAAVAHSAPAETRDRYTLVGRSETVVELFRRALLPGANGALVETQTMLPIHEFLAVQAGGVDAPWRADSLELEFSAWGLARPVVGDFAQPFDGDVQTANVGYRAAPVWARLGRQHVAGGAARFTRFDGVALGAEAELGLFVSAYGGYAALPRWDRRPGYRHLGTGEGELSSYAEQPLNRADHLLFGGRAGYHGELVSGTLSFHEQRERGGDQRSDVGVDLEVLRDEPVSGGASALLDVASRGLSTLRLWANLAAGRGLGLGVEFYRADPSLLLSRTSVLSVFGAGAYDEVGATATLRPFTFLSLESSGYVERYTDGREGARGEAVARLVTGRKNRRTTLRAGYARVLAPDNGYHSLRLSLARALAARWTSTLEAYGYFYDQSISGFRTSSVYAATLGYHAAESVEVQWGGSLSRSPYAAADAQTLVRVSWNFDAGRSAP